MHPVATDMIVKEVRQRIREGDCPTIPAQSVETLEGVIEDLALRLDRAPQRTLQTLGEAMTKFAPDLADQLTKRWKAAMQAQDERLEAFLAVLRSIP